MLLIRDERFAFGLQVAHELTGGTNRAIRRRRTVQIVDSAQSVVALAIDLIEAVGIQRLTEIVIDFVHLGQRSSPMLRHLAHWLDTSAFELERNRVTTTTDSN